MRSLSRKGVWVMPQRLLVAEDEQRMLFLVRRAAAGPCVGCARTRPLLLSAADDDDQFKSLPLETGNLAKGTEVPREILARYLPLAPSANA